MVEISIFTSYKTPEIIAPAIHMQKVVSLSALRLLRPGQCPKQLWLKHQTGARLYHLPSKPFVVYAASPTQQQSQSQSSLRGNPSSNMEKETQPFGRLQYSCPAYRLAIFYLLGSN